MIPIFTVANRRGVKKGIEVGISERETQSALLYVSMQVCKYILINTRIHRLYNTEMGRSPPWRHRGKGGKYVLTYGLISLIVTRYCLVLFLYAILLVNMHV